MQYINYFFLFISILSGITQKRTCKVVYLSSLSNDPRSETHPLSQSLVKLRRAGIGHLFVITNRAISNHQIKNGFYLTRRRTTKALGEVGCNPRPQRKFFFKL